MKAILILLMIVFSTIVCNAQKHNLTLIEKGKYDKAYKRLKRKYKEELENIILNFSFSKLYNANKFNKYNTDSAYFFIKKVEHIYLNLDINAKKKNEKKINDKTIQSAKNDICQNAYNDSKNLNTIYGYEKFMNYYLDADILLSNAEQARNYLAYSKTVQINTTNSYQEFIEKYPHALQIIDAVEKRDSLAFTETLKLNTFDAYETYINKYPDSKEKSEAVSKRNQIKYKEATAKNSIEALDDFINKYQDAENIDLVEAKRDTLAFHIADSINTSKAFDKFIHKYPFSRFFYQANHQYELLLFQEKTFHGNTTSYISFIKDFPQLKQGVRYAEDSLFYYSYINKDISGIEFYYDNCKYCIKSDSINKLFFDIYTFDGDTLSLDDFENKYPNLINSDSIEKYKTIAEEGVDLFSEYYKAIFNKQPLSAFTNKFNQYIKKTAPKQVAFVALQELLKPYLKINNYEGAIKILKNYENYFGKNDKRIRNLKEILSAKIDHSIQIKSFGVNVNTTGDEYCPIVTADNKTLYFCGKGRKDNLGGEDIYSYSLNNNLKVKLLTDLSSANTNEEPISISIDGTQMLLFKDGDLYKTNKIKSGWSFPVSIDSSTYDSFENISNNINNIKKSQSKNIINTDNWEGDGMISSDGKVLIFASDREGGIGFYHRKDKFYSGAFLGNADIYISIKNNDGKWSAPINIGSTINTSYSERSPFLHSDMKTLYFSSNGHGGLGGLDVFKSTRLCDTSWVYWSEPENLGKEINTAEDDWGYQISTDGEKAFFAKSINNNEDLFYLNMPIRLRPNYVATISGKLIDKNKNPVAAKIKWEDLETGKNVGESKSDPNNGNYFIVFIGKIYGYFIDNDEYFPISNNVDLRKEKKNNSI